MISSRTLATAGQYLFLGIMAFLSIFPFFWMVISASNSSVEIMAGKVSFGWALSDNISKFFTLVDVPLVFYSARIWRSVHPAVIASRHSCRRAWRAASWHSAGPCPAEMCNTIEFSMRTYPRSSCTSSPV